MTRTYRATVTIEFTDAPPREFSRLLDVVTDSVLSYEPSEHALVLGDDEARLITLKYSVDAGSKSSAKGRVETLLRRISYRVDGQHNPSPEKDSRFHQELVAC